MAAPTTARGRWLDPLLAERQVYVRGRGQPYFVTVTRRARTLRALAFLALLLTVLGLGTALAVGYQRYVALRDELARGQPTGQAAMPVAELAEERTAREVAGRSRDAELEAVHARSALLEGQLASAGQARDRALADLQAARQELDAARAAAADLAALRAERDRLVAELATAKAQPPAPAALVPTAAPAGLDGAEAAIAAAKGSQDLEAAQSRIRALEDDLAQARRRNEELALALARRAPSPPAVAPRRGEP